MNLNSRLQKIADLIQPGKVVADIGSDHAYLPIYLVKNKIAPRVIAVEYNSGPLQTARKNVSGNKLDDKIEIRNGDGLTAIQKGEVDVAIIAGMGVNTIISILSNSPEICHSLESIIIQPMEGSHFVRSYLQSHDFYLHNEELVYDDNNYYEIMEAKSGESPEYDDMMLEIGPILFKKKHPLLVDFLEEKIYNYREVVRNLDRSSKVGAREKKHFYEEKIRRMEKVISCLLDVPN